MPDLVNVIPQERSRYWYLTSFYERSGKLQSVIRVLPVTAPVALVFERHEDAAHGVKRNPRR